MTTFFELCEAVLGGAKEEGWTTSMEAQPGGQEANESCQENRMKWTSSCSML